MDNCITHKDCCLSHDTLDVCRGDYHGLRLHVGNTTSSCMFFLSFNTLSEKNVITIGILHINQMISSGECTQDNEEYRTNYHSHVVLSVNSENNFKHEGHIVIVFVH